VDPDPAAVITRSSVPPVPRPKVHDAALRLRLLECAGATLSTRGLAALSLRTLAADVGTSTTAVYALFGGKPGLLAALHAEAFARLGARLDAVPVGADPVEDLVALGRAYRDAALADPHFYEVMFGGALPADEQWWAVAAPILRPVAEVVNRAAASGVLRSEVDPATVALALWATVHRLVCCTCGLHPADARTRDRRGRALQAVVAGWLAAPRHCPDGHLRTVEPTF
jgi:AcrR family transcriptional regulator